MIKKLRIQLVSFAALIIFVLFYPSFDLGVNSLIKINFTNEYLILFFKKITHLGDSVWFFSLSIIGYFLSFFAKKIAKKTEIYQKLQTFFLFLFSTTLITGFLTQVVKHVLGRSRPNHNYEIDLIAFDFFSFESTLHSFPSGHTSTIFIVALTVGWLLPNIKYFLFLFASIVGFSRVVLEAHYLTDIVGGAILASIGFCITVSLFNKIKVNLKSLTSSTKRSNPFELILYVLFICIIFFTIGSDLDIFISELFYEGDKVFLLQSFSKITIFARKLFLPFILLYLIIIPLVFYYPSIKKIYFNYNFSSKEVFFIFFSTIFNLVIFVNLFLKNFWGRARPNDIVNLGGEYFFTPWFKITDSCATNCSFVSGDASVGFCIIVLFLITKNKFYLWTSLLSGFFLGSIRVLEGGHFLSDIIIACFLIYILYYLQIYFFKRNQI